MCTILYKLIYRAKLTQSFFKIKKGFLADKKMSHNTSHKSFRQKISSNKAVSLEIRQLTADLSYVWNKEKNYHLSSNFNLLYLLKIKKIKYNSNYSDIILEGKRSWAFFTHFYINRYCLNKIRYLNQIYKCLSR